MTTPGWMAEAAVEWFWLEARRIDDDELFFTALQEWERTTMNAIHAATQRTTNGCRASPVGSP